MVKGLGSNIMVDESFHIIKKRRIDEVDSVALDRISALPEPILHHIMSFLSFKGVVRTSVLSKTWEKAWHTFPDLEFDENLFEQDMKNLRELRSYYLHGEDKRFKQMRGKLLNYCENILQTRHQNMISVRKFTLKMKMLSDVEFADQCICYAIENNVKELKLEINLQRDLSSNLPAMMKTDLLYNLPQMVKTNLLYNLPQMVLCSKSINVLELQGCKLELPRSNVKLSSLTKLYLSNVNADDQVVKNLVGGCPLVEILSFEFCQGFKSLKLFGLSKLSKIKVRDNTELEQMEINALNARAITVQGPAVPSEVNIAPCKNLKYLDLCTTPVVDEWLSNQISRLPLLECLVISFSDELESVKISSPSLKRLNITRCMKLVALKLETPNLSKFEYTGEIISFSSRALTLSETDFYIYSRNINYEWYIKYVELLGKFQGFSKVLNLHSDMGEIVLVPTVLRHILLPPLSGVKHLNFQIHIPRKSIPIAQVVDGLLWLSPHVETVFLEFGNYFKKLGFQFSYKEQQTGQCCKSFPVSCWEHCIQKVEIEIMIDEFENNDTLPNHVVERESKRYVFEDDELLEEIHKMLCCF